MRITQKLTATLLRYDPLTGFLFWRQRDTSFFKNDGIAKHWNKRFANQRAFTAKDKYGYFVGSIFNKRYKAHRIIWLLTHGDLPNNLFVDHIDGNRSNNKLENLRLVTSLESSRNIGISKNNKSGVMGVHLDKERGGYTASVSVKNKSVYIGRFKDLREAEIAVRTKRGELGFHPNHGRTS